MERLNRTRLLFNDDGLSKLMNATVMVVGCGAVGSVAIEALARTGVGNLIIVDFDKVESSNINRQLFALDSTIGKPKVDVAKARIADINPNINVQAFDMFWDKDTDINKMPDFIIDAIDTAESKIALYKWAQERNIPIISSMGAALKTDVAQIKISELGRTSVCPLAAKMRKMLRENELKDVHVVFSTEKPAPVREHAKNMGSNITVTGIFGLMLANWVIMKIINDN